MSRTRRRLRRESVWVFYAFVLLALAISTAGWFVALHYSSKAARHQQKLDTTLPQAVTAGFLLVTAYYAWLNVRTTHEGQSAERLKDAIGMVGDKDNLFTRLAGLYALGELASANDDYHWPVMELLCTYVREQSRSRPRDTSGPPPAELQAIITILAERKWGWELEHQRLNLQQSDLRQLDFAKARLRRADLSGTDLGGADLRGADLRGAQIEGTSFAGAVYDRATRWPVGFYPEQRGATLNDSATS
jgi:hypothetical protein